MIEAANTRRRQGRFAVLCLTAAVTSAIAGYLSSSPGDLTSVPVIGPMDPLAMAVALLAISIAGGVAAVVTLLVLNRKPHGAERDGPPSTLAVGTFAATFTIAMSAAVVAISSLT